MDKKDNNNQESFNDPINWKSLGFFSAEDYLIYIFKKTEKITAALYLVSGLLKDEEPIKWELRDRGIDLLSSSFSASNSLPGDKNAVIQSLFTAALETLSLLNVAKISNLVSDMNHKLLVREIDNVVAMLRDRLRESAESAGYILSESFFKTPDLFSSGFRLGNRNVSQNDSFGVKGQKVTSSEFNHANNGVTKGHELGNEKKLQRRELIISTLKTQSNLTIKDFAKVIKDCSEKTIQRELIELVNMGLVKKDGERRWSRYSLRG
jgi:DNA-binding transcriptional ArsR family regulator